MDCSVAPGTRRLKQGLGGWCSLFRTQGQTIWTCSSSRAAAADGHPSAKAGPGRSAPGGFHGMQTECMRSPEVPLSGIRHSPQGWAHSSGSSRAMSLDCTQCDKRDILARCACKWLCRKRSLGRLGPAWVPDPGPASAPWGMAYVRRWRRHGPAVPKVRAIEPRNKRAVSVPAAAAAVPAACRRVGPACA